MYERYGKQCSRLPEFKLSEEAVKVAERVPHAVRVEVEVPQGLVSGDAAHLLQAPGQVLGQGPHGHALDLPVHDDGARGQALGRGTRRGG